MKLFGIKDENNELYFNIEKNSNTLKLIDKIAFFLFDEDMANEFENRWQTGLPEKEDYFCIEKEGIYMGVIISEKRVHIILRGIPNNSADKTNIKQTIIKECK